MPELDAIVIGSGPNGLAAAVTLARAGLSVRVYEKGSRPGGGSRTSRLTVPGFLHDDCSAVHPMALASEFFREFQLERRIGLRMPAAAFAHPLDGGRAAVAFHDIERTAATLGVDADAYVRLMRPLAEHADAVAALAGHSLLRVPTHPITAARFALRLLEQGSDAWNRRFHDDLAPALLTGVASHAVQPLPSLGTAAVGLALTSYAHGRGWPIPAGGSQAIVDAMVDDIVAHGGEVITHTEVTDLAELPSARAVLFDLTPRAALRLAGVRLPAAYRRKLAGFRYGNGVAKVDFALSDAVPWTNPDVALAGTVHLGGTRGEMAAAEAAVASGRHAESPYVLSSQPTVVDSTRAPAGKHVLWAYTHVPAGSDLDQTEAVIRQVERFAPGFRDTIIATSHRSAVEMAEYNPNYIGGDIASGAGSIAQLVRRPVLSVDPWRMPGDGGLYLASASTPPGPGVHGLAGWFAALSVLRNEFGTTIRPNLSVGA